MFRNKIQVCYAKRHRSSAQGISRWSPLCKTACNQITGSKAKKGVSDDTESANGANESRVRLEKSSTSTTIPQLFPKKVETSTELPTAEQHKTPEIEEGDEYEFHWQDKVFCQREIDKYSSEQNCLTVLEKKYYKDIQQLRECGRPTKRLFSYVDHDSFANSDSLGRKFTNSPTEQTTPLAEKMETVRHRRGILCKSEKKLVPKTNIVSYEPSDEMKRNNRLINTGVQTMYIMADASPANRPPTEEDEIVLCTIKIDGNGVLSIKPDFNKGRKPYNTGGSSSAGRDLYHFTVEHTSKQLSRQEQLKEYKMYKEMYARHADFLASCIGQNFEMTPADVFRLKISGSIVSAKNFEYDHLYIQWFIDLPQGWVPNGVQRLSGATQTCATRSTEDGDESVYSYPFSLDLLYKECLHEEKSDDCFAKLPLMFIEVLSLDEWQRYRTEGYGYMSLPYLPGVQEHAIDCWRPTGESYISELRRFFIGSSPELEDPTYIAVPSTFEGSHLSKFGFSSLSTGSVSIRTNTVVQSRAFLQCASSRKTFISVMDKIGFSVTRVNILNVLDAFQKAKQRMIAARENLRKDFIETLAAFALDDETEA